MTNFDSSRLFAHLESFVHEGRPAPVFEHYVGNFTTHESTLVTEIGFSPDDAAALARLAVRVCGDPAHTMIALYPYVAEAWRAMSATGWTTLHHRVFQRPGFFGLGGTNPWVVGHAHDEAKLAEILYWAWTLPGRDTLLIVHAAPADTVALVRDFEDDREDTDTNEWKLIRAYPTILSRAFGGRHVRIFSTVLDSTMLRSIVQVDLQPD